MRGSLAAVVLAAGGSTRMGRPKPLIPLRGEPLVVRAVRAAREAWIEDVRVVTRPEDVAVRQVLEPLNVHLVPNLAWRAGLGGSIALGVRSLAPGTTGVLLLACDQPAVTSVLLERLVLAFHGPDDRVACAYDGTLGIPALFGAAWFPRLAALSGDQGAKALLTEGHPQSIPFAAGSLDLDTPEDLEGWMDMEG